MAELFPRVKGMKLGYHRGEVEAYFSEARLAYEQPASGSLAAYDVRRVSFELQRGGYSTAAVDTALDRLEVAFATRAREQFVRQHGQDEWMKELAERAQVLYPRLRRPLGDRFARPAGLHGGYDAKQVDGLLNRLIAFFDEGKPLSADEVRSATFAHRSKRRAYDERTVDAYLARTVDVLLGAS